MICYVILNKMLGKNVGEFFLHNLFLALDPDLEPDPYGHFPDLYNNSYGSASLITSHFFLGGEPLQPPTQQPGPSRRQEATPVRSPARPLARSPGRSPRRDASEDPVLTSPPTSDDEDAETRPIIRMATRVGYMNRNDRRKNRLAKAGVYI